MRTATSKPQLEQYNRMLWQAAQTYQGRFFGPAEDRLEEARQEAAAIFAKVQSWHDPIKGKFSTLLYRNLQNLGEKNYHKNKRMTTTTTYHTEEPLCHSSMQSADMRLTLHSMSYPAQRMSALVLREEVHTKSELYNRMRELGYTWSVITKARKEIEAVLREA